MPNLNLRLRIFVTRTRPKAAASPSRINFSRLTSIVSHVISGASEVLAQISEADDPGEVLRSYQPAQDQFLKLKGLLANLKGKSGPTEEFKISRHGPTLQLGSQSPEVAVLKKRFAVVPQAGAATNIRSTARRCDQEVSNLKFAPKRWHRRARNSRRARR